MVYKYLLPFCRLSFHFVDFFFFFGYSGTFFVWCSLTCLFFILLLSLLVSDQKDHCHSNVRELFLQASSRRFTVSGLMFTSFGGRGTPCSIWDPSWSGIKPMPSTLGVQSLSFCTAVEVWSSRILKSLTLAWKEVGPKKVLGARGWGTPRTDFTV